MTLAASFQSLDGRSAAVAATNPCGLQPAPPTTYSHVVVIMEENLAYASAIGNANAPYLNMLASVCALATNFHNETHPSQPNYLALFSGSTQGVTGDACLKRLHGVPNLGSQLIESGQHRRAAGR